MSKNDAYYHDKGEQDAAAGKYDPPKLIFDSWN